MTDMKTCTLPHALSGERREFMSPAGRLSYYVANRSSSVAGGAPRPLLLIHSINAAGSAYEVKPIFENFSDRRPVYALELPGFGFSERSERRYTPRLMTDAIHAMLAEIHRIHGTIAVDALALSLSCEFLSRAAREAPDSLATLALISPTGFGRRSAQDGAPGSTLGMPGIYRLLTFSLWTRNAFTALTSRPSIRYFLEKTWGAREIDAGLFDYSWLTTHQPGARFAPYDFVSGFLFSGDIRAVYRSLQLPVWMVHGIRGDFVDYGGKTDYEQLPNWTIEVMSTGALPHFERPGEFIRDYQSFLSESGHG